jgi:hypothetical protein
MQQKGSYVYKKIRYFTVISKWGNLPLYSNQHLEQKNFGSYVL